MDGYLVMCWLCWSISTNGQARREVSVNPVGETGEGRKCKQESDKANSVKLEIQVTNFQAMNCP